MSQRRPPARPRGPSSGGASLRWRDQPSGSNRSFSFTCRRLSRVGGRHEARVLGGVDRRLAEVAGVLNGRASTAHEHEGKFWADECLDVAVGCGVVPAADSRRSSARLRSGASLVLAIALAIDIEPRLVRSVEPRLFAGGLPANATFVFGDYGHRRRSHLRRSLRQTGESCGSGSRPPPSWAPSTSALNR